MTLAPSSDKTSPMKHPKRLLLLFLPIAMLIAASMFFVYRTELDRLHSKHAQDAHEAVSVGAESISRKLQWITRDMRYLSDDSSIQQMLDDPSEKNIAIVAKDWVSLSHHKQEYDKIRWIDDNGMERLRINYAQPRPKRVPPSELQDKRDRYFFADTFKLDRGEIFVSPFDLNVENDQIEVPYKPTIRIGMPVFDSKGKKRGILLINFLANKLLDDFSKSFRQGHTGWLLNPRGYWLKGSSPEDAFGFMFGKADLTMAKRHPEVWQKILAADEGQFKTAEGLWTFITVVPLVEGQKTSTGSEDIRAASREQLDSSKYFWKAVHFLPTDQYGAGMMQFTITLVISSLTLLALFFVGIWRLVTAQLEEKNLRENLEGMVEKRTHDLAQSETRLRTLIETIPDIIRVKSADGVYVAVNSAFERLIGASRKELIGERADKFVGEELAKALHSDDLAALEAGKALVFEEWLTYADDGHKALFEVIKVPMYTEDGQLIGILGVGRDITERKKAEDRLKLAALVSENTSQSIMVTDDKGFIIAVNPAFERITGYTEGEVAGKNANVLSSGRQDREFYQHMWASLNTNGHWQGEIWNKRKNGEIYPAWITINAIRNPEGKIERFVELCSDFTKRKQAEELIFQQANFDPLTGLPNRHMFMDRLEQEAAKARRLGLPMALMILDLDHFKDVNDTLGHDMGDVMLKDTAERLKSCVRDTDAVARLGGDEFTIILSAVEDISRIERVAQNILHRLAEPYQLGKETVYITTSLGVTLFPDDAANADDLLKNADQAMYAAKSEGRNRRNYFKPSMQESAQSKLRLVNDLRNALSERQFMVMYQPIVDLGTGEIRKAESLIRWNHPVRGMISPGQFITIAEETEAIVDIGNWVFREAAQKIARWRAEFNENFQISINMSPVQFRNAGISHKTWPHFLKTLGIPGEGVVIEITEGLLMDASESITSQLLEFRDAGMQVALDDFGTGYSSLSYIKKFDIDFLKIDQSFVRNLAPNSSDLALCEAIIMMAHRLGIKVIAEGVETELQRDLLAAAGCNFGQGMLFSKAVPAEEFESLLRSRATGGQTP